MDIFSERFKQLKAERDVTYREIGEHLGVKTRAVQLYASGAGKPDYWGFLALADYFGVSLDYLAGRSDTR